MSATNNVEIPQAALDEVLLAALSEALDVRGLAQLRAGQDPRLDRTTALGRELSLIEARIGAPRRGRQARASHRRAPRHAPG